MHGFALKKKIDNDVRLGRAFDFPGEAAMLRVLLLAEITSSTTLRVAHSIGPSMTVVNGDRVILVSNLSEVTGQGKDREGTVGRVSVVKCIRDSVAESSERTYVSRFRTWVEC